jgi:pyruvate kinase
VHEPEHPEHWTEYIRQWVLDHDVAGKLAILTEGPSAKHPDTNHRMEIIELPQTR